MRVAGSRAKYEGEGAGEGEGEGAGLRVCERRSWWAS